MRQRERLLEYAASHIQHMQKALTEMNLQLHHVVADITGSTGLRIIRTILAGERDPEALACLRHYSCHSSAETIAKALTGSYRTEHLFALEQALALYDAYHEKASACDVRIEAVLKELSIHRGRDVGPVPPASRRRHRTDQANALAFDARAALFALLGKDITGTKSPLARSAMGGWEYRYSFPDKEALRLSAGGCERGAFVCLVVGRL